MKELRNYVNWRDVKTFRFHNFVPKYGYIERTSCIGNLDFTDKRLPKYGIAV